jgi:hypothetical protein
MSINNITITDILPHTDISRKQVNNRIKKLNQYTNLLYGGGKGKGGLYQINPIFFNYLTLTKSIKSLNDIVRNNNVKEVPKINLFETYKLIEWTYFGCYSPPKVYSVDGLLEILPLKDGELLFYTIHGRKSTDELHIHFVVVTKRKMENFLNFQTKSIQSVKVSPFRTELRYDSYNYFLIPKENQFLVDYGFLLGMKNHHRNLKIMLNKH